MATSVAGPQTHSIRDWLYRQLEPRARAGQGLSPLNWALGLLILVVVALSILETEPTIARGHELFFDDLEFAAGLIFLIEYCARLWVEVENPRYAGTRFPRIRYALTPIAIIDLVAILPALFAFGGAPSLVLRFFRVLRMLRLAKLGRTSRAWEHIRDAMYERRFEFGLILGMVGVVVLISGSLLYWAEADVQPDKFGSIPRALWWSVITLTTVGYGDVTPITTIGKILAGIMALCGVMFIALPTGLFAASFTEAMQRHREHCEREEGPDG